MSKVPVFGTHKRCVSEVPVFGTRRLNKQEIGAVLSLEPLDSLPLEPFIVFRALSGDWSRLLPSLNSRRERDEEEIGTVFVVGALEGVPPS